MGRAPRRAAAMNPTSMPNSHLNKNQVTGRILIIEDKVRKVCGDGSFREIKFKQTNSCFDASEPVNPRIRPGGHYQTHMPQEELPTLHANGEYVRQIGRISLPESASLLSHVHEVHKECSGESRHRAGANDRSEKHGRPWVGATEREGIATNEEVMILAEQGHGEGRCLQAGSLRVRFNLQAETRCMQTKHVLGMGKPWGKRRSI